jgi:hypothetical protein
MVVWDPAEIEPPQRDALAALRDAEIRRAPYAVDAPEAACAMARSRGEASERSG